jgi:peroxiredoxin
MRLLSAFLLSIASATAFAAAPPGASAPAFAATDLNGNPVNLADYKGRTVVLEWHNFGCPFVQKHYRSGNMQSLQAKYGADVVWLSVNSTSRTSSDYTEPARLSTQLRDFHAAPAKYLMDESGAVGMAYGARTTPHLYVIDPAGRIVYNGAIDDKRSTDLEDVKTAKNYVAAALNELKAGKPVTVSTTTPYGCSVKYR